MKKTSLLLSALALGAITLTISAMRHDSRYGRTMAHTTPAERLAKSKLRVDHWNDTLRYAKKGGASKEYMAWAERNLKRAEGHLANVKGMPARKQEIKKRWSQASPQTKARVAATRQRVAQAKSTYAAKSGVKAPVKATDKKTLRGGLAKSKAYSAAYARDVAAKKGAVAASTTAKPKTWTERLFGTKK